MRVLVVAAVVLLAGCATPPQRDEVRVRLELLVDGLDDPVFVAPLGDDALLVVQQRGRILLWDGTLRSEPFLDLRDRVACCGERGLLGLALHPQYDGNGRLFVYYTALGGDLHISEFRAVNDQAQAATEVSLLVIEHSEFSNHNGGMLAFGPDGMLYAGVGDGGSGGDPHNHAQDTDSLLGKILRLDVDPAAHGNVCVDENVRPKPACPAKGNPFIGVAGADEVLHYGLRNPWRFSFDLASGDLWIGDVGQGSWEEIDRLDGEARGVNLGWSRYEGSHLYSAARSAPGAVDPVSEYSNDGAHCAVTGGYVYRGSALPALRGAYVFGDYCSGTLWTLRPDGDGWVRRQLMDTGYAISSFAEDADGELLLVDHGGAVFRFTA